MGAASTAPRKFLIPITKAPESLEIQEFPGKMSLIFLEFTALLNKFAIISECSDASKKIPYLYINSGRPDCPAAAAVIQ